MSFLSTITTATSHAPIASDVIGLEPYWTGFGWIWIGSKYGAGSDFLDLLDWIGSDPQIQLQSNPITSLPIATSSSINPPIFNAPDLYSVLLPHFPQSSDHWLSNLSNPYFSVQEIQCLYPISGQYGNAPRAIFYILAIFSVFAREYEWATTATLGYVMTYSSIAAVHALVLVVARKKLLFEGWAWVTVSMGSSGGVAEDLAVWPMTWDEDCDPVLAIVGAGFLLVTPMQLWSKTFRNCRAKPVLLLWSLLMLIGVICAFVNEAYVDVRAFPQFRFCTRHDEKLPVSNSGTHVDVLSGNKMVDKLNETIWALFLNEGERESFSGCLYPCFHTRWPLRSNTGIVAIDSVGVYPSSTNVDPTTGWRLMVVVYFFVCSSGLMSLILFVCRMTRNKIGQRSNEEHQTSNEEDQTSNEEDRTSNDEDQTSNEEDQTGPRNIQKRVLFSCLPRIKWIFDGYLQAMSVVSFLGFLAWIEWVIWYFPKSETFEYIGQWGVVVLVGLVIVAALVDRYSDKISKFCRPTKLYPNQRPSQPFSDNVELRDQPE